MAPLNLPDTGLAAMNIGKDIYLYFQATDGGLAEICRPHSTGCYSVKPIGCTARLINGEPNSNAAKLFTPLGASSYQGTKVGSRSTSESLR